MLPTATMRTIGWLRERQLRVFSSQPISTDRQSDKEPMVDMDEVSKLISFCPPYAFPLTQILQGQTSATSSLSGLRLNTTTGQRKFDLRSAGR